MSESYESKPTTHIHTYSSQERNGSPSQGDSFWERLKLLGFRNYQEYLNSELWQNFRKKYYKSKKRKHCTLCEDPNFEIELHHKTYIRLGNEKLDDVIPLCRIHHEQVHECLNEKFQGKVEYTNSALAILGYRSGSRGRPLRRGRYRKGGPFLRRKRAIEDADESEE